MTATENTQLVRRFFAEVWNGGRLDLIDELVDQDFINFGRRRGTDGLRIIVGVWRSAFPDLQIRVEEEFVDDDAVVLRVTCSGTHRAELRHLTMGVIPPTGRHFAVEQIHIFRLRKGKIHEHRACRDDLGMLYQLGRVPLPETPTAESRERVLETLGG